MKSKARLQVPPPECKGSPRANAELAKTFEEIADLLEIENANLFRIRAYRNVEKLLSELKEAVPDLLACGEDLKDLPGIGADLDSKIREFLSTGNSSLLTELQKRTPHSLLDLLNIPGLGPRRVKTLYQVLKIENQAQLEKAALDGKLSDLPGFGESLETQLIATLKSRSSKANF